MQVEDKKETVSFKPAVVFDMGGKFDKSFNEGVWNGVKKFTEETGIEVMEFEVTNETQREQAMRRMVDKGATVVLGVGFAQADAISKVAADNPNVQFSIIDVGWLDAPNLRQYVFKEHEGSYLVGIAAAKATKTGKVGFVGGQDIGLISKFACGYVGGVKSVLPNAEIYENMTGSTPSAWNDPARGAELTRSQIDRGADVVYHAAGGTGVGVIQAAADAGKLAIGVDSNQNGLAPGSVLTSMLKRVDVAAYETFMDAKNGKFTSGVKALGIAEGGVDWALDENNESLITADIKSALEAAREAILSGSVTVHDYLTDQTCPY
ncbi:BMP family ABC transporter substrate-binding protein [Alphaproteobacteria bacterium]|nr:BMP family ABC transporter substrate-binding protein [Alphaproteobacteria bacterium]MDA9190549.1 BMP family ABC transporter substrate-binding protein [Alphaproteobacteria bacterium]MDC0394398.1 BMP family ABC transporter substrate-binding protein [Alphaproteobacteria bacterium]MDC0462418.1 BMP family ABC transporter substrate-binding protein [Alphaproteobacteria bacterium]MDC3311131.1 BMP family ABC transporter substrate-binding protein [Alphaproteobacteria bacterium]